MSPTHPVQIPLTGREQEGKKKPLIKESRSARRARERDTQKKARKAASMLLQVKKAMEAGDDELLERLEIQYKAWKTSLESLAKQ